MERAARAEVFLARARARFGDANHDYSAVRYSSVDQKVTIGCPQHGPFERSPERYLASPYGCPWCGREAGQAAKTPEERLETQRRYMRANRRAYNEAARRHYYAHRDDPEHRAKRACRGLLARVMRAIGRKDWGSTAGVHGYTTLEFRHHIESQFEGWMSWANHGEWHIDHIVPVSAYVQRGQADPAFINRLANLRPLRAVDNLKKKAKLIADEMPDGTVQLRADAE